MFQNEHLLSRAVFATRLRLLPQTDLFSGPQWEGSLPILCDVFLQRHEANQLIREYTTEAWDKLARDFEKESQSIFRFVFDGYRRLIHEVEDQLRDATEQSTQWQMDHVSRFSQRTVHQELLCAIHLSSRGYGLLQNLQNADKAQLQQFILVILSAMCFHEESLASRISTHEENARLCRSLELLSVEAGSPHEPWTRARSMGMTAYAPIGQLLSSWKLQPNLNTTNAAILVLVISLAKLCKR
ncbi:hypothetical protein DER45DRAFT_535762 [Fusarium avenaceum]|nr:hypothetical protein DER45DRAFT_535762 [Fusarium avenaceum]